MNFFKKILNVFTPKPTTYVHASYEPRSASHRRRGVTKQLKRIGNALLAVFCIVVLALSIRGMAGNPNPQDLNRLIWKDNGPLELSPERGRYALMYSIAEDKSFSFSTDLARFAAPDVAYKDGKYVSLFAPAVSFIVIPGFLLGKMFGLAQIGTFAVIALFALINMYLIRAIAIKIGAHPLAATLAGITFLFASPAFAYAVTLYQHHISTFLILMSVYLLLSYDTIWSLMVIWILCALSISVDYPNFFMMLPIGVAAMGRVFVAKKAEGKVTVHVPIMRVLSILVMVLPLAFFLWFNKMSYGDPFQLSGTIERSIQVNADGSPVLETQEIIKQLKALGKEIPQGPHDKSALNFFQSRLLLPGFYELFVSPDRGMLWYTPIMFLGFIGIIVAIRNKVKYTALLLGIIGFNILLYGMWTDPYGGWAFGARYLIPSYALLSIFIAYLLTRMNRYSLFLLFFFAIFSYSVSINTLGAITSNRNPPQVEAQSLAQITKQDEPYTYARNINMLNSNISKSYVYDTYAANSLTAWQYYMFLTMFIIIVSAFILTIFKFVSKGVSHAV